MSDSVLPDESGTAELLSTSGDTIINYNFNKIYPGPSSIFGTEGYKAVKAVVETGAPDLSCMIMESVVGLLSFPKSVMNGVRKR